MLVIREHIKTGNFKPIYLLHGTEDYLKKLYRNKLKSAIVEEEDSLNYNYFEGKDIDQKELSSIAQTLPFFAERRLIIVENSGFFKNQNDLADHLKEQPESTIFVFVENEVDKRNRLYKLVKDKGTISEMNGLDEKNLKLFVVSLLEQEGKKIQSSTLDYLLDKCGTDMLNLKNETDKLISYIGDREVINVKDIEEVVTPQITGRIFQMIDAISIKEQEKALQLYYDLVQLREKPMTILYLIVRHFNILLQVKALQKLSYKNPEIAAMAGVPPFAVAKYLSQSKNFTGSRLRQAIEYATEIEESVKTGRMIDMIGVELLIITFSSGNSV